MSWNPNQPQEQPDKLQPYQQDGPPSGYIPQRPCPLGQAIQELPSQYIKILTKPGVRSFSEEQGKAEWSIIWVQLLFLGLLGTLIGLLRGPAVPSVNALSDSLGSFAKFSLLSVPLTFLITVGLQYVLARVLRGTGDYKTQAYNQLLFTVPLTIVTYILQLIPIVGIGALLGLVVGIYEIALNVYSIMATHRLGGGKATLAVLLPIIVLVAITVVGLFVLVMQHIAVLNQ
ncbi:MAG: Yip1 family protein [Ktedonobacteraceae bacterium]